MLSRRFSFEKAQARGIAAEIIAYAAEQTARQGGREPASDDAPADPNSAKGVA